MNTRSFPLPFLLALLGSVGAPAFSQVDPPLPPTEVTLHSVDWPDRTNWGNAGTFGASVTGRLTNLPGLDTAIMRDERVFVLAGTKAVGALMVVDNTLVQVQDIALLPGGGIGTEDAVVFVDSSIGLGSIAYDTVTQAFVVQTIDPTWTAATRVFSADLDLDGEANDLALVVDDKVYVRYDEGLVPGPTYTFSSTVSEVAFPDYDWDGVPDVAAIVGLDLELVGFPPVFGLHPGASLAVVPRGNGDTGDYLAWCREDIAGGDWSVVLMHAGGQESPVGVGPSVAGLIASDVNGDGLLDLSPYGTSEHRIPVYYNTGGTPHFTDSPSDHASYDLVGAGASQPMPGNLARPSLISPSFEAYPTIVYPLDDSSKVARLIGKFDDRFDIALPTSTAFGCSYELVDEFDPDSEGVLHVFLDLPDSFPIGEYSHIEVIQWRQGGQGAFLGGVAESLSYAAIVGGGSGLEFRVDVRIHEDGTLWPTSGPYYYMPITVVKLDGQNKVTKASSTILIGWRIRDTENESNTVYMEYLRNQNPDGAEYVFKLGIFPPVSGGVSVGGGVALNTLPPWNPFDKPTLPAPLFSQTLEW